MTLFCATSIGSILDAAGVPFGDISEKSDLVHRARGTRQSEDDEAFARRLQAEMEAMEGDAASSAPPPPTAEQVAALEEDEAMAQRLQAELYAEEDTDEARYHQRSPFPLFGGGRDGADSMQQLQRQMAEMMQSAVLSRQEFQQRQQAAEEAQPVWRRARRVEGGGSHEDDPDNEASLEMRRAAAEAQVERVQQQRNQIQMMFQSLMPQLAPLLRAQGIAVEEDMSFEQLMELQDVQIGADEETIAVSTETMKFEGTKEGEETPTCTVCMSEFEPGLATATLFYD